MGTILESLPRSFNVARYFLVETNVEAGRGDRIAFYHREETLSYLDVLRSTKRAAGLLSELGVEPENRVAVLLPDSPELVFAFWGALWIGAVPIPINTTYTADDVQFIIRDSRAKVLLTTEAWSEGLGPLDAPALRRVLRADGGEPFRSLLDQAKHVEEAASTCGDEPAFWLYTSGSTGRPKGVIHAHHDMVVCAELYGKGTVGLRESDISYSIAKIPFAYGLGNTLYMPAAVGASAVLSDALNVFDTIADLHRYRPTVFWGIPSTYANLLATAELSPVDVSSLRLCLSAAEQLPEAIWRAWRDKHGSEICEGIGTTELLHIFISNRPGECRPGSSGRPVAGYDVRIVDADGHPVPPGEIGDLEVAGESLMLGYWNRRRETRAALFGSSMRTGDKYLADEDGFLRFMGRKDDLFKVNGLWVSPMEVEEVLMQHPSVLACAVVHEGNVERALQQVIACVVLKPSSEDSPGIENKIRQFSKSRLPRFKAPSAVRVLDSLPYTATGKVDRKALRKHLERVSQ
jgi:benzoate-CoA ligase family protein